MEQRSQNECQPWSAVKTSEKQEAQVMLTCRDPEVPGIYLASKSTGILWRTLHGKDLAWGMVQASVFAGNQ